MFKGFQDSKDAMIRIPGVFFDQLLPLMDNLAELKLVLYFFWRIERSEGDFRYLDKNSLLQDDKFLMGLDTDPDSQRSTLDNALNSSVKKGILLPAILIKEGAQTEIFFINSTKGRAAVKAIQNGEWQHFETIPTAQEWIQEAPNIYKLYEENIGLLTPLIADKLRDAENEYPEQWISEAITIAAERNKRNWSYINAILHRWQEGGRDDRKDRKNLEKDWQRYFEGEFNEFIED
jgi:DNA replication protein